MRPEIYVSVDIEADGPIPGVHSMLNFGAAAFLEGDEKPVSTFEVNLKPLEGASQDPDTMAWWLENQEAWKYVTSNTQFPGPAMEAFHQWLSGLNGRPVMVVYPTYDFLFLYWYMVRFLGLERARILGFAALDIKSLAMGALNHPQFRNVSKRTMEKVRPEWLEGLPAHDHTGLTDAIGQGMIFIRVLREIRAGARP